MTAGPVLALHAPDGPGLPPETMLLGLPLARRTVLAAARSGFSRVVVVGAPPALAAALEGSSAELVAASPAGAVRLPWNVVVHRKGLQALAAGAAPGGVAVASAADRPRAEKYLLRGLIKDEEGFMSRYFDRAISLAISRRLAPTRITPNQMTFVAVGIGLLGAPFFLWSRPAIQVVGGLLFLLHSIVDGCDGELARLKFQESRDGGILDFWGDNVVHVAVFGAMGLGLARSTGRTWPLWCGLSAVVFTGISAWYVYRRTMIGPKEGPLYTSVATVEQTQLSKVADAVSRRDFIYLILIMSAFGVADWFVVSSAVIIPVYFLALLAVAWNDRRAARSPA
ncbi:MAG TPA: CDP-alcohol phosphatidyltransferase family protein [Thermoanaerobaculia bacterium]|nr:CDP-alcohol phosphatidyltransferase family protein [Thermoanaerobaculia bacterium]